MQVYLELNLRSGSNPSVVKTQPELRTLQQLAPPPEAMRGAAEAHVAQLVQDLAMCNVQRTSAGKATCYYEKSAGKARVSSCDLGGPSLKHARQGPAVRCGSFTHECQQPTASICVLRDEYFISQRWLNSFLPSLDVSQLKPFFLQYFFRG